MNDGENILYIGPSDLTDKHIHQIAWRRHAGHNGSDLYMPAKKKESLAGTYGETREYYDRLLPQMRLTLQTLLSKKAYEIVHVDLGNELTTLFAAIYVAEEIKTKAMQTSLQLCVHAPKNIGGGSMFMNAHPIMRRMLALKALGGADIVWVVREADFLALTDTYPTFQGEVCGYPLEEAAPVLPSA